MPPSTDPGRDPSRRRPRAIRGVRGRSTAAAVLVVAVARRRRDRVPRLLAAGADLDGPAGGHHAGTRRSRRSTRRVSPGSPRSSPGAPGRAWSRRSSTPRPGGRRPASGCGRSRSPTPGRKRPGPRDPGERPADPGRGRPLPPRRGGGARPRPALPGVWSTPPTALSSSRSGRQSRCW